VTLLAILCNLLDVTAAGAVVLFLRNRPQEDQKQPSITSGQVALFAILAAVVFMIKLPVLFAVGMNLFGLIRLVYYHLVLTVPLCGLAVLLFSRKHTVSHAVLVVAWISLIGGTRHHRPT